MAERVVLHVGMMKSGTSYLQRLMARNAALLAERGVLFPGPGWSPQVRAIAEVMTRRRVVRENPGAWQLMVDQIEAWPGTAVVSMEYLAVASRAQVAKVTGAFPPGSVEVVVTARDLGRAVPAMWQESLKNGRFLPFDQYVLQVIGRASGVGHQPARSFWRQQGLPSHVRRWASVVGLDRVTVVTVPPPGAPPEELWLRFAAAAGIEAEDVVEPPPANESLGVASATVLRALNERLEGFAYPAYVRKVKQGLAKQVMSRLRRGEEAVGFDPPQALRRRSARMVRRVRKSGVRVVGDLDDLTPRAVAGVDPAEVPAAASLAAAVSALEGLLRAAAAADTDLAGPATGDADDLTDLDDLDDDDEDDDQDDDQDEDDDEDDDEGEDERV